MAKTSLGSSAAVASQIDQMETISATFVIPSLVVLLAGASIPKEFDIFGMHLRTDNAYGMVVATFDAFVLLFCTACWKAGDLLEACDEADYPQAIGAVLTHKWLLNPFSYSGGGTVSALWCAVGPSLLVLAWWVTLCGMALLSSVSPDQGCIEHSLYVLYWILGFVSGVTVVRLSRRIYVLSEPGNENRVTPVSVSALARTNLVKLLLSGVACGIGGWLFHAFRSLA